MTEPLLRNRTFEELQPGDSASLVRIVARDDIDLFAAVSGDLNPAHLDATFAATGRFGHIVAHAMWMGALVSAVIGTKLPGPGTVYLEQDLKFVKPVAPGDTVTASVTVRHKEARGCLVTLDTECRNQAGELVLSGTARVVAPEHTIEWPAARLPDVSLRRHERYQSFIARAHELPPVRAAIVHPCSPEAILAAVEVRDEGLLEPVLIGPEARIRAAAEIAQVSLEGMVLESTEHSHAAAARAVALASAGEVSVLVKGSLQTNELLRAVIASGSGLRTERRISHVYAMDVPAYPKPLIITDAAVNIQPTLEHKRDICQNAVDMLRTLGVSDPKVAVLAAVEMVNPHMPATLDAAALTVMAARGQIQGAKVDGPLAFDNAISPDAARTKGIVSPVAGQADILLVPDLEAGNMLAKQLIHLAGATAAGLVLGARVPVVLTSRADPLTARIASAALAKLLAKAKGG
ncbi:MAG: bifunctional enoyl-CoA hydratase/phosphate acetyltransferase [Gammaproteobacteria bacterium]|jgi:phosphate acetyltransferase|nr:bifunctional enoyl-CoA hydratase/phosphate acetyltransferase [Gammaproteobacteria bacterium]